MFAKDFRTIVASFALFTAATPQLLLASEQLPVTTDKHGLLIAAVELPMRENPSLETQFNDEGKYGFFAAANAQALREQAANQGQQLAAINGGGEATSRSAIAWLVGTLLLSTLLLSKNVKRRQ